MKTHRVLFVALACLGLLLASPGAGSAASYPSEPIKLLVPFEAGGSSDISARIFAKYAEKELGGRIAIVNMAGAAGSLASTEAVQAKTRRLYSALAHSHHLYGLPYRNTGFYLGFSNSRRQRGPFLQGHGRAQGFPLENH